MQVLYLARRAGFLRAEARVRHAEGLHGEALACLARDTRCDWAVLHLVQGSVAFLRRCPQALGFLGNWCAGPVFPVGFGV